ncbi:LPXTG cell wall anchor domain-containing protein [Kroppenstedtia sanguinis]|uniref:LPXTG cell wall anchor domain-containing protein n=1 Tax=Kroppenstedtia sanguinis TaxID=1380684 RepID=A0ABW4C9J0_9BACL
MVVHKKRLAAITSFTVVGLMATSPVYANPAEGLSEEAKEQTSPASPEIQPELGNNEISLESPIAFPVTNLDQTRTQDNLGGSDHKSGGSDENPGENIGDEPDPTDPGDDPGEEPDPTDPGDNPGPEPDPEDPGDTPDPGTDPEEPGNNNPGEDNPGENNPGDGNPGEDNPGDDGNDGGITQPEPTDPGTPPHNPESVNTLPHAKDQQQLASKDGAEPSKTEEEGGKLPKTSVSHPTQMAGGLMMSLLGAAMLFIRRFRSNGA